MGENYSSEFVNTSLFNVWLSSFPPTRRDELFKDVFRQVKSMNLPVPNMKKAMRQLTQKTYVHIRRDVSYEKRDYLPRKKRRRRIISDSSSEDNDEDDDGKANLCAFSAHKEVPQLKDEFPEVIDLVESDEEIEELPTKSIQVRRKRRFARYFGSDSDDETDTIRLSEKSVCPILIKECDSDCSEELCANERAKRKKKILESCGVTQCSLKIKSELQSGDVQNNNNTTFQEDQNELEKLGASDLVIEKKSYPSPTDILKNVIIIVDSDSPENDPAITIQNLEGKHNEEGDLPLAKSQETEVENSSSTPSGTVEQVSTLEVFTNSTLNKNNITSTDTCNTEENQVTAIEEEAAVTGIEVEKQQEVTVTAKRIEEKNQQEAIVKGIDGENQPEAIGKGIEGENQQEATVTSSGIPASPQENCPVPGSRPGQIWVKDNRTLGISVNWSASSQNSTMSTSEEAGLNNRSETSEFDEEFLKSVEETVDIVAVFIEQYRQQNKMRMEAEANEKGALIVNYVKGCAEDQKFALQKRMIKSVCDSFKNLTERVKSDEKVRDVSFNCAQKRNGETLFCVKRVWTMFVRERQMHQQPKTVDSISQSRESSTVELSTVPDSRVVNKESSGQNSVSTIQPLQNARVEARSGWYQTPEPNIPVVRSEQLESFSTSNEQMPSVHIPTLPISISQTGFQKDLLSQPNEERRSQEISGNIPTARTLQQVTQSTLLHHVQHTQVTRQQQSDRLEQPMEVIQGVNLQTHQSASFQVQSRNLPPALPEQQQRMLHANQRLSQQVTQMNHLQELQQMTHVQQWLQNTPASVNQHQHLLNLQQQFQTPQQQHQLWQTPLQQQQPHQPLQQQQQRQTQQQQRHTLQLEQQWEMQHQQDTLMQQPQQTLLVQRHPQQPLQQQQQQRRQIQELHQQQPQTQFLHEQQQLQIQQQQQQQLPTEQLQPQTQLQHQQPQTQLQQQQTQSQLTQNEISKLLQLGLKQPVEFQKKISILRPKDQRYLQMFLQQIRNQLPVLQQPQQPPQVQQQLQQQWPVQQQLQQQWPVQQQLQQQWSVQQQLQQQLSPVQQLQQQTRPVQQQQQLQQQTRPVQQQQLQQQTRPVQQQQLQQQTRPVQQQQLQQQTRPVQQQQLQQQTLPVQQQQLQQQTRPVQQQQLQQQTRPVQQQKPPEQQQHVVQNSSQSPTLHPSITAPAQVQQQFSQFQFPQPVQQQRQQQPRPVHQQQQQSRPVQQQQPRQLSVQQQKPSEQQQHVVQNPSQSPTLHPSITEPAQVQQQLQPFQFPQPVQQQQRHQQPRPVPQQKPPEQQRKKQQQHVVQNPSQSQTLNPSRTEPAQVQQQFPPFQFSRIHGDGLQISQDVQEKVRQRHVIVENKRRISREGQSVPEPCKQQQSSVLSQLLTGGDTGASLPQLTPVSKTSLLLPAATSRSSISKIALQTSPNTFQSSVSSALVTNSLEQLPVPCPSQTRSKETRTIYIDLCGKLPCPESSSSQAQAVYIDLSQAQTSLTASGTSSSSVSDMHGSSLSNSSDQVVNKETSKEVNESDQNEMREVMRVKDCNKQVLQECSNVQKVMEGSDANIAGINIRPSVLRIHEGVVESGNETLAQKQGHKKLESEEDLRLVKQEKEHQRKKGKELHGKNTEEIDLATVMEKLIHTMDDTVICSVTKEFGELNEIESTKKENQNCSVQFITAIKSGNTVTSVNNAAVKAENIENCFSSEMTLQFTNEVARTDNTESSSSVTEVQYSRNSGKLDDADEGGKSSEETAVQPQAAIRVRSTSLDSGYKTPSPFLQESIQQDKKLPTIRHPVPVHCNPEREPICAMCQGKAHIVCSQCRAICYCNETCQETHWYSGHGKECTDDQ